MPFPEGTPPLLKGLYGAIEGAVQARASTADLWAAIRSAAGGDLTGLTFRGAQVVSTLRGVAAGVRNAEDKLAKAAADEGVDHRHVGVPPWAREVTERSAAPKFVARVQMLGTNTAFLEGLPGEPEFVEQWVSINMGALPATVGGLREMVTARAAGMQTGRGQPGGYTIGPVVGVGRVQLLAV